MDSIRTPKRHDHRLTPKDEGAGPFTIIAVMAALLLVVGFAVKAHRDGYRITIGQQAKAPTQPEVIRKVIYLCNDAYGREVQQETPCAPAISQAPPTNSDSTYYPPSAPRPSTRAPTPNPNQALLDAADARYRREVEGAERAGRLLDRQLAMSSAAQSNASAYRSQSCELLCDELQRLRNRMRAGYTNQESRYLHDRQNSIFRRMGEVRCEGCRD